MTTKKVLEECPHCCIDIDFGLKGCPNKDAYQCKVEKEIALVREECEKECRRKILSQVWLCPICRNPMGNCKSCEDGFYKKYGHVNVNDLKKKVEEELKKGLSNISEYEGGYHQALYDVLKLLENSQLLKTTNRGQISNKKEAGKG